MSEKEELPVLRQKVELPYIWAIGRTGARFFKEFKNKRIMGTRCPKCNRVLVPARKFCPRCLVDTEEQVEVSDKGRLRTCTICYYSYPGQPRDPPYAIGVIDLDGADTGFMHFVGGVDLSKFEEAKEKLRAGVRVEAVWKEKREGNILDIEYFRPVE